MSWSFNLALEPGDTDNAEPILNKMVDAWRAANPALVTEAFDEQVEVATTAALLLVDTVLPPDGQHPGRILHVHLNGHANPGHLPTAGWADDAVSVSLYFTKIELKKE